MTELGSPRRWKLVRDHPGKDEFFMFRCKWEDMLSKPSFRYPGKIQITIYENTHEICFFKKDFFSGKYRPICDSFHSKELETVHG